MEPTTFRMLSGASIPLPPVVISFTADNYNPAYNTTAYLYWTVTNSVSVSISADDPFYDIGSVGPSGSAGVNGPGPVSRTYTLTAVGLDGLTYNTSIYISWAAATCVWALYGRPEWC